MFQYLYPYINGRLLAPAYPPQRHGWSILIFFLSHLTGLPMYRVAEVEVAALYPRIREVALNRGYQGCLKITNYCLWIEIDPEDCHFV
ncbi:hypothetical protein T07_12282 [Trichinella nelsoni]|uniref:Uncharacterized protein n=1 Tax=Trichinella nelsoni TaxID=6336 RepID=A0A0V0SGR7_9BILA|nr:hypothetical protein T07_12282 [Trichinella nelsoni]